MRYQGKLNVQVIKRFQREYVQGRAEHFPQSNSSLQEGIWATQRTAGSKRHFWGGGKGGMGVGRKANELCICHQWRSWRVRSPAGEKELLPLRKTCQILQWKRQVIQGSEKLQKVCPWGGEVNTEIMLPATIPCNDLLKNFYLYLDGGQIQA